VQPRDQNSEFEKLLHELKLNVLGQITGFAAGVAEEIDSLCERKLFGLGSDTRSYSRLFSIGPPKSATTRVNQMLLCVGALSFFWHAIDRLSFRQNDESLRGAVLDPTVSSLSGTLADMLNKQGMDTTAAELLAGVQALSLRYAGARTLLGTSAEDEDSAVWFAARAIAEDVDYPKVIVAKLMRVKLTQGLVTLDLANRIKALEATL